jgi:hypothetical protein
MRVLGARVFASRLGLLKAEKIGLDRGVETVDDIIGGTGMERILAPEVVPEFNRALREGIIKAQRLRFRFGQK